MFDALKRAERDRRQEMSRLTQMAPPSERVVQGHAPTEVSDLPTEFVRELGVLRNSLEGVFTTKEKRTLLFTSANPREGTTTLASSFARFVAMQGANRVLLCEMNARTPSFTKTFSVNGAGVTDYFVEERDLSSIVQPMGDAKLDLLHVGSRDATVIQLNLNRLMPQLLEEARQLYDTIIIDAPPVISCPETPSMTAFVDGVVFVIHAGKTKRQVVLRSLESIATFDGNVLGIVLNRKKYYIPEFIYKRL